MNLRGRSRNLNKAALESRLLSLENSLTKERNTLLSLEQSLAKERKARKAQQHTQHKLKVGLAGVIVCFVLSLPIMFSLTSKADSSTGTVLPVSKGGTGASELSAGNVVVANGTNALSTRAIDTNTCGSSGLSSLITSAAVNACAGTKQNSLNRSVQTNLGSTSSVTDTGGNITPGVTGTLGIGNGGTGINAANRYALGNQVRNASAAEDQAGWTQIGNILIQWGSVSITPVANTWTTTNVTFAKQFTSQPSVVASHTTGSSTNMAVASAGSPTNTGFTAGVYRVNTTSTNVRWIAIGFCSTTYN